MAQKNRKINKKMRGSRSCGYGCAKKHRGAGSRGGRGNAGSTKHKQKLMYILGGRLGKIGFHRHPSLVVAQSIINLDDIDVHIEKWAAEGKAKKTAGGFSVDMSELGYDKVLGSGKLTHKIEIKADSFSESAKKKIAEAGGKVVGDGIDTV
jgi:large subunit ribosomal protein L15